MASFPDSVLEEDWQGLESETERLLITYGYPTGDERLLAVEEISRQPKSQVPAIVDNPTGTEKLQT